MAEKLKVGQEVVLQQFGQLIPTVVSFVGRKYFRIREQPRMEFELQDFRPVGGPFIRRNYRVYVSEQDFLTEEERVLLRDKLGKIFRRVDNDMTLNKLSLEKLKKLDVYLKEIFET
jgi:hypothetical protein